MTGQIQFHYNGTTVELASGYTLSSYIETYRQYERDVISGEADSDVFSFLVSTEGDPDGGQHDFWFRVVPGAPFAFTRHGSSGGMTYPALRL